MSELKNDVNQFFNAFVNQFTWIFFFFIEESFQFINLMMKHDKKGNTTIIMT